MSLVLYRPPLVSNSVAFEAVEMNPPRYHHDDKCKPNEKAQDSGNEGETSDNKLSLQPCISLAPLRRFPNRSGYIANKKGPPQRPHPVSRGKSLVPTNLPPKKRKPVPPPLPFAPRQGQHATAQNRKRRRCLPRSNPTNGVSVSQAAAPQMSDEEVPIKKFFPGKLFRLVESCSNRHTTGNEDSGDSIDTAIPENCHGEIISWIRCRQTKHNNHVNSTAATTTDDETSDGCGLYSLVVWDKDEFLESHLVKSSFPSQSTFRSFERQLNSWGFNRHYSLEEKLLKHKSSSNAEIDTTILTHDGLRAFHHPSFQNGRPDLLKDVKRRPPGKGNKNIKETIRKTGITPIVPKNKRDRKPPPEPLVEDNEASVATEASSDGGDTESEDAPSIRTDIILPSGVCLRINQRIPDWAIPAREAAVKYLYQKHSRMANRSSDENPIALPHSSESPERSSNDSKNDTRCKRRSSSRSSSFVESTDSDCRKGEALLIKSSNLAFPLRHAHRGLPRGENERLGSLLQPWREAIGGNPLDDVDDADDRFCDASENEAEIHQTHTGIDPCGGDRNDEENVLVI